MLVLPHFNMRNSNARRKNLASTEINASYSA